LILHECQASSERRQKRTLLSRDKSSNLDNFHSQNNEGLKEDASGEPGAGIDYLKKKS
jgi:hypothetical protein